jgi:hypothetical protein
MQVIVVIIGFNALVHHIIVVVTVAVINDFHHFLRLLVAHQYFPYSIVILLLG